MGLNVLAIEHLDVVLDVRLCVDLCVLRPLRRFELPLSAIPLVVCKLHVLWIEAPGVRCVGVEPICRICRL